MSAHLSMASEQHQLSMLSVEHRTAYDLDLRGQLSRGVQGS